MKFAAIADVHGNSVELEAVLADIAAFGISEVVNLRDHLSGPLEARRTADLLIERGFPPFEAIRTDCWSSWFGQNIQPHGPQAVRSQAPRMAGKPTADIGLSR